MHLWMLVTRTSVLSAVELRFRCNIGPMFAVSEPVWLEPLVTEQLSRPNHNTIGSWYVLTRFRLVPITYLHSVVCEGLLQGRMQTQPRGPHPTICNIGPLLSHTCDPSAHDAFESKDPRMGSTDVCKKSKVWRFAELPSNVNAKSLRLKTYLRPSSSIANLDQERKCNCRIPRSSRTAIYMRSEPFERLGLMTFDAFVR